MLIISTSPSPYLAPLQLMPCTHPPLFYLANTGPVEFREQFDANFFNSTGLNDGHTDNGELDFDFLLYNENAKEDSAGEDTRYARLARICKVRVCVCACLGIVKFVCTWRVEVVLGSEVRRCQICTHG